MKPSTFVSIYCILGVRNVFLQMFSFSSLKLDKNLTITLFFGWIKVGAPHFDIFTLLSTPSWKILSVYVLNTASCDLGAEYGCTWYRLASVCSSISTSLVFTST